MWRVVSLLVVVTVMAGLAEAAETKVVVRAKSKDAKFIGTSMGGALVTIRRHDDGRVVAQGLTQGGTGDTARLIVDPIQRGKPLADAGTARFEASLDIETPTLVTIEVSAPVAQPQSTITSSTQIWLIPGKHVVGDGVILEIPGLAVDVVAPQTPEDIALGDKSVVIPITANVVMLCGCPIEPDSLWKALEYEVGALVTRDGAPLQTVAMAYAGKRNTFEGRLEVTKKGVYELTVYAYHPSTGNSGIDRATITVR
ncbi:MAG: hypothetical protein ACOYXU_07965 [Nitrospirota bacterium]